MEPPNRATGTSNLSLAAQSAVAGVNVQLPATVVSYDAATQTATVKIVPCFRRRDPAQGGAVVCYDPPNIPGVPVAWPSATGISITWPLAGGDPGLLMFCDRSTDEWKSTGDSRTTPQDTRRHDLSDAIFLPGHRSPADPIPAAGLDGTAMVIRAPEILLGSSAATSFVALATLVETQLAAIWLKFNTHIHIGVLTGPGVSGIPSDVTGTAGSVKATKVRAE